ncbi:hypothetical protein MTO96_005705 [Rhipicephalus appendiculatus]
MCAPASAASQARLLSRQPVRSGWRNKSLANRSGRERSARISSELLNSRSRAREEEKKDYKKERKRTQAPGSGAGPIDWPSAVKLPHRPSNPLSLAFSSSLVLRVRSCHCTPLAVRGPAFRVALLRELTIAPRLHTTATAHVAWETSAQTRAQLLYCNASGALFSPTCGERGSQAEREKIH